MADIIVALERGLEYAKHCKAYEDVEYIEEAMQQARHIPQIHGSEHKMRYELSTEAHHEYCSCSLCNTKKYKESKKYKHGKDCSCWSCQLS